MMLCISAHHIKGGMNMDAPTLYRKRLIPAECICLKDDEIIAYDPGEGTLFTKWHAIRPREDLHHGISGYFLNEGIKVSKFYRDDGKLLYWYCDIIDSEYDREKNALITTDLLADVIIFPDGFVKVVDLDELAEISGTEEFDNNMMKKALMRLDHLLKLIYSDEFSKYKELIEGYEEM